MAYNLTNVTEATNIYAMTAAINDSSGGLIGILTLFTLWVVIFIASKGYDTKTALFTSGFITTIASILLFTIGFININVFIISLIVLLLSLFVLMFTE